MFRLSLDFIGIFLSTKLRLNQYQRFINIGHLYGCRALTLVTRYSELEKKKRYISSIVIEVSPQTQRRASVSKLSIAIKQFYIILITRYDAIYLKIFRVSLGHRTGCPKRGREYRSLSKYQSAGRVAFSGCGSQSAARNVATCIRRYRRTNRRKIDAISPINPAYPLNGFTVYRREVWESLFRAVRRG